MTSWSYLRILPCVSKYEACIFTVHKDHGLLEHFAYWGCLKSGRAFKRNPIPISTEVLVPESPLENWYKRINVYFYLALQIFPPLQQGVENKVADHFRTRVSILKSYPWNSGLNPKINFISVQMPRRHPVMGGGTQSQKALNMCGCHAAF